MRKITALIGLGILSVAVSAQAVLVAGWDGHNTGTTRYPLAAANTDSAVAETSMTYVGLTTNDDGRTIFHGWDAQEVIDLTTDYLQFSISMKSGQTFDPIALRFTAATYPGYLKFDVRSSQDNYANSLGVFNLNSDYLDYRVDLSSLARTDGVIFRLYGFNNTDESVNRFYGAPAGNGKSPDEFDFSETDFDNFLAVSGVVPEPTSLSLVILGAAALLRRRIATHA